MDKKDLTLLTIVCAKENGLSPIQLQKSLFVLGKSGINGLPTDFYEFIPYNYGPFSVDVYSDADALVQEGMVASIPLVGRTWSKYIATPAGQAYCERMKKEVATQLREYVQSIVDWVASLDFSQLLRAIYAAYPEYRVNSIFQDSE